MEGNTMEKEKILEMSRKENKNRDIADLEAEKKARSCAGVITSMFATLLFMIELLINRGCNFSLPAVIMFYQMAVYFAKYFVTKDKLNLIGLISYAISTTICTSITIIEFTK